MDIWGRLFKKRRAAEAAFYRAVGAAEERVRTPQGPRKSAEAGAELRAEVIDVIDEVEARTGSYAFVFGLEHIGGTEQVLMVSSAFTEALDAHPRGELLQPAFELMLTTAQRKSSLLEHWAEGVGRYIGGENTRDALHEKAALIASFILYHYDIPCEAAAYRSPVDDDTECELKLEAAAGWSRIVDELAYRFIRPDRELLSDYLQDALAHHLALQGCTVAAILDRAHERGEEYARFREWVVDPPHEDKGLLWIMARYALAALAVTPSEAAIRAHIELFLEALGVASVRELLTGRPRTDAPAEDS